MNFIKNNLKRDFESFNEEFIANSKLKFDEI